MNERIWMRSCDEAVEMIVETLLWDACEYFGGLLFDQFIRFFIKTLQGRRSVDAGGFLLNDQLTFNASIFM